MYGPSGLAALTQVIIYFPLGRQDRVPNNESGVFREAWIKEVKVSANSSFVFRGLGTINADGSTTWAYGNGTDAHYVQQSYTGEFSLKLRLHVRDIDNVFIVLYNENATTTKWFTCALTYEPIVSQGWKSEHAG
jgi:hypothetical protein